MSHQALEKLWSLRRGEWITSFQLSDLYIVCQIIYFKILLLVYKSLSGLGPKYISDLLLR